jgi:deoxyribodipyrimidine photo-lyase
VARAISGERDRPWPERLIFSTVRFMSYESTHRIINSAAYVRKNSGLGRA